MDKYLQKNIQKRSYNNIMTFTLLKKRYVNISLLIVCFSYNMFYFNYFNNVEF